MRIFAIDPGPVESGWCVWDTTTPHLLWEGREWKSKMSGKVVVSESGTPPFGKIDNRALVDIILKTAANIDVWAIETVASYGMRVGKEVFDTCRWSGRFEVFIAEEMRRLASGRPDTKWHAPWWPVLMGRAQVKLRVTGKTSTKDSDVRAALIERFGSQGKKDCPGILYGVSHDAWAAVALAVAVESSLQERGMLPKPQAVSAL